MRATRTTISLMVAAAAVMLAGKAVQPRGRPEKAACSNAAGLAAERQRSQALRSQCNKHHGHEPLARLALQGERAVIRLAVVLQGDGSEDQRRQAAEELARIGSPSAVKQLLLALASMADCELKEETGRLVAGITDRRTADALMEAFTSADDPTIVRACQTALSRMADGEMVNTLTSLYAEAEGEQQRDRIAGVIAGVQNSEAFDALVELAGQENIPSSPLAQAAIRGIASIGTAPAASYLLQRLEGASEQDAVFFLQAIVQMNGSEAKTSLQYAAQGNKEATTEQTRVAAILALANYRDEESDTLLKTLAANENVVLSAAAQAALEAARQSSTTP